ncbi:MAG: hypothetical protein C0504_06835 [Candidatus Solibacter sp.]|nr:hypothetical protein [Candidatus Solibacter sp.]
MTVAPPPRCPRICGAIREIDLSAIVIPVSRRVFSIAPAPAGTVLTAATTPPGPPVNGVRLALWV